jgi:hypothetical protein
LAVATVEARIAPAKTQATVDFGFIRISPFSILGLARRAEMLDESCEILFTRRSFCGAA